MRIVLAVVLYFTILGALIAGFTYGSKGPEDICRITWENRSMQLYGRGDWIVRNRAELDEWVRKQDGKNPAVKYGVECKT